MNKLLIILLAAVSFSFGQLYHNNTKIDEISVMGQNWHNSNRGGITFKTDKEPKGVGYFIIRPNDIALQLYLSQLLSAQVKGSSVNITYKKTCHKKDCEGEVIAIRTIRSK